MAEIRDLSAIKEKWTRVTPQRTEDYKIGVKNGETGKRRLKPRPGPIRRA